ncbi:hypothetical protein MRX96_000990 [Rhipicephalus microplus]
MRMMAMMASKMAVLSSLSDDSTVIFDGDVFCQLVRNVLLLPGMTKFFSQTRLRLTIGRRCKIAASPHQQRARSSAPAQRGGLDSAVRCLPRSALPQITRADSDDTGPQARTARADSVVCAAFPMHDASLVRRLKAPAFVNAGDPDAAGYRRTRIFEYRNYKTKLRCEAGIVQPLDGHHMLTIKATDGDHHRQQVETSWEQGKQTVRKLPLLKQTPGPDAPQTEAGETGAPVALKY